MFIAITMYHNLQVYCKNDFMYDFEIKKNIYIFSKIIYINLNNKKNINL